MQAESPIQVILVGCGAVSQQFYLPTLRVLEGRRELTVHALVDPSAASRQVLGAAFPRAKAVDSLAALEPIPGALAIIATPPKLHAQQTRECVERGWHVLCEKPMASTSAECEQMIADCHAGQRLLAIGLYKRFFPSSAYLKTLFTSGQLGELRRFSIVEGGPFRWPAASPSFFNKRQTPGGVLLDIGVHVLDLLCWWLGDPADLSYADDAMGGLETNSVVKLTYPNGTHGRLHLSRDWATANEYRFEFSGGTVAWKVNDANGLSVQLAGAPAGLRASLTAPLSQAPAGVKLDLQRSNPQSFIAQLQNVLAAIRGTEPLLIPGEEGMKSLRLIEACYQHRTLLPQPWLSPEESVRAQTLVAQP